MHLEVSLIEHTFVLHLNGEFTSKTINRLETKINKLLTEHKNIVVNLSKVKHMNHDALRLLLTIAKRVTIIKRGFSIYTPHKNHLEEMEKYNLDQVLPIFKDLNEALAILP